MKVSKKSSEIEAISTHKGTYKVKRLSFGIKSTPAEFNRIMDKILKKVTKTIAYFNDIIIHKFTERR